MSYLAISIVSLFVSIFIVHRARVLGKTTHIYELRKIKFYNISTVFVILSFVRFILQKMNTQFEFWEELIINSIVLIISIPILDKGILKLNDVFYRLKPKK